LRTKAPTEDGVAAIAELALAARSREEFRDALLRMLQPRIGFDSAVLVTRAKTIAPTTLNKTAAVVSRLVSGHAEYRKELEPIDRAARASRSVVIDREVFSERERDARRFYRELIRPQRIRTTMHAHLDFPGAQTTVIVLARHEGAASDFAARHAEAMRALVPALALAEAVWHARQSETRAPAALDPDDAAFGALSQREREIVSFVARGLRNRDVAAALGTSHNTVRKQLASVFAKLGVATRTELVRRALEQHAEPATGTRRKIR
jgi:DNA-binding CsgD family transcriptional regulator